jgi:hypothetical protein
VAPTMNERQTLGAALNWSSIACGVILALATGIVLHLLGAALGLSMGNGVLEGGFAAWWVILQVVVVALGATLATWLARPEGRLGGIAVGVLTWAFVTVFRFLTSQGFIRQPPRDMAWTALFAVCLTLGSAILGGLLGTALGARSRR